MSSSATVSKLSKYELLRGRHAVKTGEIKVEGGLQIQTQTFKKGDIIVSDRDLVKQFGAQKFRKIHESDEAEPANLESMTVQQLRSYAEDNEISLGDATRKDDILAAIQLALEAR